MTLTEQVFAQAALLAGELDGRQTNLLRLLCGASASSLTARLREGLTPEDCKADFIAAASLLALAQLFENVLFKNVQRRHYDSPPPSEQICPDGGLHRPQQIFSAGP